MLQEAQQLTEKKIILQFTILTFCIAYCISGILIVLGHFGYQVYSLVDSLPQFAMNIPFALYILSPAIASYLVLKHNKEVTGILEWLKKVFWAKNRISVYLIVITGLVLYFGMHIIASGRTEMALPFYMFFLSLPGNLFIGGLEETGWMYVLQPRLDKKYGFAISSLLIGITWVFWHIPLFFIPGTSHCKGLINFWMFNIQVMSLSFFRGAVYKIAGNGYVFAYVLFHTMFNATSSLFIPMTMTWPGTIVANAAMILFSITIVAVYKYKSKGLNS